MDEHKAIRVATIGGRLQLLLRDSTIYGASAAIAKMMGLLTIPILARSLSPEQYGTVDILMVSISFVVGFLTMGQDAAVARYYYETECNQQRRQIVTQALLIQGLVCTPTFVLVVLGSSWLLASLTGDLQYRTSFFLAIATLPFALAIQFWRNLLRWTFSRLPFLSLTLGATLCQLLLIVIFVLYFDLQIVGYFAAQLVTLIAFSLLGLYLSRQYLTPITGFSYGSQLLRFGWPYMLTALAGLAFPALDRIFMSHFCGLRELGIYAIGFKMASVILFPIMAFQSAWGPFFLAVYKESNAARTYDKVLLYFTIGISSAGLLLVLLADQAIPLLVGDKYRDSSVIVMPLVFAFIGQGVSWITGIGIGLSKRTIYSLASYLIGLVASALLISLLVKDFGGIGVAWGVFGGYALQGISYTIFGYHVYPLRLEWKRPLGVLVMAATVAWSAVQNPLREAHWDCLMRALLFATFVGVVWAIGIPRADKPHIFRVLRGLRGFRRVPSA